MVQLTEICMSALCEMAAWQIKTGTGQLWQPILASDIVDTFSKCHNFVVRRPSQW